MNSLLEKERKHRYYVKNREKILERVKARISKLRAKDPEGFKKQIRDKRRERYRYDDEFREHIKEYHRKLYSIKHKSIKSTEL